MVETLQILKNSNALMNVKAIKGTIRYSRQYIEENSYKFWETISKYIKAVNT